MGVPNAVPSLADQRCTVPSALPLIRVWPSGLRARARIGPSLPVIGSPRGAPVLSQRRIVPSAALEITVCPSGLITTAETTAWCASATTVPVGLPSASSHSSAPSSLPRTINWPSGETVTPLGSLTAPAVTLALSVRWAVTTAACPSELVANPKKAATGIPGSPRYT